MKIRMMYLLLALLFPALSFAEACPEKTTNYPEGSYNHKCECIDSNQTMSFNIRGSDSRLGLCCGSDNLPVSVANSYVTGSPVLVIWLDAGDPCTIELTSDNSRIVTWQDKSILANDTVTAFHFTQATDSSRPAYNTSYLFDSNVERKQITDLTSPNKAVIEFDGVDDVLSTAPTNLGPLQGYFTVFAVIEIQTGAGKGRIVGQENIANAEFIAGVSLSNQVSLEAPPSEINTAGTISDGDLTVVTWRIRNNDVDMYYSGVGPETSTLATPDNTNPYFVGGFAGSFFQGYIAEILIFDTGNTEMDDVDRADIESYLRTKWGAT